jgi:hypothetical protein
MKSGCKSTRVRDPLRARHFSSFAELPAEWGPERAAAASAVAAYEEQIRLAASRALRAWTGLVRSAVLEGVITASGSVTIDGKTHDGAELTITPLTAAASRPNPEMVPSLFTRWYQLADRHIVGAVRGVLGKVFAEFLREEDVASARPWQEQYLAEVHNRLVGIADDTYDLIRAIVVEGVDTGASIEDMRDRIGEVLSMQRSDSVWPNRATVIARTEVMGAYNGGTLAAWRVEAGASGEAMDKVWLATDDNRTRHSHDEADGQRVDLGARFEVGGALLDHPGDPTAPAKEVIQCRCTMLRLAKDETTPEVEDRQLTASAADDPLAAALAEAITHPIDPEQPPGGCIRGPETAATETGPDGVTATEKENPVVRKWVSDPYLAPFGEPTGDGRIFKAGSLTAREFPLPVLFQESSGYGHEGSVVVGRILEADLSGAGIVSSGDYLDDESVKEHVDKAIALTSTGLGHVSVDLASVVAELVDEDGNPVTWDDLFDAWDEGEDIVVLEQVVEGELIAVTQVATPAFAQAKIRLVESDAEDKDADEAPDGGDQASLVAAADSAGEEIAVGDVVRLSVPGDQLGGAREETPLPCEGTVTDVEEDQVTVEVTKVDDGEGMTDLEEPVTVATEPANVTVVKEDAEDEAGDEQRVEVVASEKTVVEHVVTEKRTEPALTAAGPLRPPASWFEDPKLTGPTALTVTDEGRIYGHVALWNACHVAFANTCVTPPPSPSEYRYFHVGEVVCDDGSRVAVGNLTLGGRHASLSMGWKAATQHYDDSGKGAGVVRLYEDEFGIAYAGAITPGLTDTDLYDLRRCPVSGDWREVAGQMDLIGVLAVNVGGFPTPRFASGAHGRTALVAAPGVRPDYEQDGKTKSRRRRSGGLSSMQVTERIKREVKAEMAAERRRAERLNRLAAGIKRDPKSRIAELAASIR